MKSQNLSRLAIIAITCVGVVIVTYLCQPLQAAQANKDSKPVSRTLAVEKKDDTIATIKSVLKAPVPTEKDAQAKQTASLKNTVAAYLSNNEAMHEQAYSFFTNLLQTNRTDADPIIAATAAQGAQAPYPAIQIHSLKLLMQLIQHGNGLAEAIAAAEYCITSPDETVRNEALLVFQVLFSNHKGFTKAHRVIERTMNPTDETFAYARASAQILNSDLTKSEQALMDETDKKLTFLTQKQRDAFNNAQKTIDAYEGTSNEKLAVIIEASFAQGEALSKNDLVILWQAAKTMQLEPLAAACAKKLAYRLIDTDPTLASIDRGQTRISQLYYRATSLFRKEAPLPIITTDLRADLYKETAIKAKANILSGVASTRALALTFFYHCLEKNIPNVLPIIIEAAQAGAQSNRTEVRNDAISLFKAIVAKGEGFAAAIETASTLTNSDLTLDLSLDVFKALFEKNEGFAAATAIALHAFANPSINYQAYALELFKTLVEKNQALKEAQKAASDTRKNPILSLRRYGLEIFKALVEKNEAIDEATAAASAALTTTSDKDSATAYYVREQALQVFSALFAKGESFDDAIAAAETIEKSPIPDIRKSALDTYKALINYNQATTEAAAAAADTLVSPNTDIQNNSNLQQCALQIFDALFKKKHGYNEAYRVIYQLNEKAPANKPDTRSKFLEEAITKTASEKEINTAKALAFLTTEEQRTIFNAIIRDYANATLQQHITLLNDYYQQLADRNEPQNTIKSFFASLWKAAHTMHLETLASACARILAQHPVSTEPKQGIAKRIWNAITSYFRTPSPSPLEIAVATETKKSAEEHPMSLKERREISQTIAETGAIFLNNDIPDRQKNLAALKILKDFLEKDAEQTGPQIILIANRGTLSQDPLIHQYALELFKALVEKNQAIREAPQAALKVVQSSATHLYPYALELFKALVEKNKIFNETMQAASDTFVSSDTKLQLYALDLFKALFEKGHGFNGAIKAASTNLLSTDATIQANALQLFSALFKQKRGYAEAYRVISQIENPKDPRIKKLEDLLTSTATEAELTKARSEGKLLKNEKQQEAFRAARALVENNQTRDKDAKMSNESLATAIEKDALHNKALSSEDILLLWNAAQETKLESLALACARNIALSIKAAEDKQGWWEKVKNTLYNNVAFWHSSEYPEKLNTMINAEKERITKEAEEAAKAAAKTPTIQAPLRQATIPVKRPLRQPRMPIYQDRYYQNQEDEQEIEDEQPRRYLRRLPAYRPAQTEDENYDEQIQEDAQELSPERFMRSLRGAPAYQPARQTIIDSNEE